jgi:hypothetical protein
MSSFYQAIVGGRIKEQSVKEMDELGLIDETKVDRTKTGSIKGLLPGGVKGWQIAAQDPYAWVNDVLLPALKEHSITDPEDIQSHIATIFQQATAAQMAGIFATQQQRIQKDWNLVHGAKGLEGADVFQSQDPLIAWQGFTEQFKNLLAVAGGPLVPAAAAGLNKMASGIAAFEHATEKHPLEATAAVFGTAGMLSYASLKASLWALRGLGGALFSTGKKGIEDLTGDAAVKAMQAAQLAESAGPSFMGTLLTSAGRYGLGPLGMLLGTTEPANAGEPKWPVPPHYTIDDIQSAVHGGGPVTARVEGDANLNLHVDVSPSPLFDAHVEAIVDNKINAFKGSGFAPATGTTGSLGESMPYSGGAP